MGIDFDENYSNTENSLQLKNANTIKILGILSFFIPLLSIITLIISSGYNKKNNYGGSSDIKVGKICAKVSLGLSVGFIIIWILSLTLWLLPTIMIGGA